MARARSSKKPKATLGSRLRELRKERDLTGQELAARTGVSQATISKVETGAQAADMDLLVKLAAGLKLSRPETAQLLSESPLVAGPKAASRLAEVVPFDFLRACEAADRQDTAADWERDASEVREFAPTLIPGLLQIPEYARAAIRLSGISRETEVDSGAKARLRRQKLLRRRKHFSFLLAEGALRARVADSSTMCAQLEHLRTVAKQPRIRIGVIPWNARLPSWLPPNFSVFDDKVAYVELPHGEMLLREANVVRSYLDLFETLSSVACYDREFDSALTRLLDDARNLGTAEGSMRPRLR